MIMMIICNDLVRWRYTNDIGDHRKYKNLIILGNECVKTLVELGSTNPFGAATVDLSVGLLSCFDGYLEITCNQNKKHFRIWSTVICCWFFQYSIFKIGFVLNAKVLLRNNNTKKGKWKRIMYAVPLYLGIK